MRADSLTIRDLGAAGTALIGLYFVLSGIAGSVYVLVLSAPSEAGGGIRAAVPWLVGSVIPGAAAIIARRRIASLLALPESPAGDGLSRPSLLAVGVGLFGVLLALQGFAQAGQSLTVLLILPTDLASSFAAYEHRASIGAGIAKLVVGGLLAARPALLVRFL